MTQACVHVVHAPLRVETDPGKGAFFVFEIVQLQNWHLSPQLHQSSNFRPLSTRAQACSCSWLGRERPPHPAQR